MCVNQYLQCFYSLNIPRFLLKKLHQSSVCFHLSQFTLFLLSLTCFSETQRTHNTLHSFNVYILMILNLLIIVSCNQDIMHADHLLVFSHSVGWFVCDKNTLHEVFYFKVYTISLLTIGAIKYSRSLIRICLLILWVVPSWLCLHMAT